MDYAYQEKHPPTKLAAMVTASNACLIQDQPWLADSVATYHVTASLSHLNFPKPYNGQDHLTVGNDQNLPITHTGNVHIPLTKSNIHLKNVLRVPSIASNLALVHKFCHDNNCWCYFDENVLSIQALTTGKVLYQGRFCTWAIVKMEFIPSILKSFLSFLCLLRFATMLLVFLLLISLFGTRDLVILMIMY